MNEEGRKEGGRGEGREGGREGGREDVRWVLLTHCWFGLRLS